MDPYLSFLVCFRRLTGWLAAVSMCIWDSLGCHWSFIEVFGETLDSRHDTAFIILKSEQL